MIHLRQGLPHNMPKTATPTSRFWKTALKAGNKQVFPFFDFSKKQAD
jgi:hypothetical protein